MDVLSTSFTTAEDSLILDCFAFSIALYNRPRVAREGMRSLTKRRNLLGLPVNGQVKKRKNPAEAAMEKSSHTSHRARVQSS